ncbi:MAG: MFS transporter, partial [Dehalococcoidia bacterium]|nr:MFS transporter [Dehalococcoidia bacterium]
MSPPGAEVAVPPPGWRQTFSSLSGNRDFAFLYVGNIAFFFGMSIMITLRGWLVIVRWDNASYLGYIMATVALPMIVLSPIGGVIADRVDKRKLIIAAQASLVVTQGAVAALLMADALEFWHLLVLSPLSGTAFALNMPVRQALVAMLVPRERL